jgi:hypothetical protein
MSRRKHVPIDRTGAQLPLERAWWISDHDDEDSLDDMFIENCDVHIERMDNGFYWIGIYVDEEIVHIDITAPREIRARPRR